MKTALKYLLVTALSVATLSCSTGGSGGSAQGGGNTPVGAATGVNLGNISTIPLVSGSSSDAVVILTNNMNDNIILTNASYTPYYGNNAYTAQPVGLGTPVDVSLCTHVGPRGTCSVQVSSPVASGVAQYLISMTYHDDRNNTDYSTSQIVSFSSDIPANPNGIVFASNNNNAYNQVNGNTTLSFHIVLTQGFNNLTAISENNNPAFQPTLTCNGYSTGPYPANTSCDLFVTVSGTNTSPVFSGNIIVSGDTTLATALQDFHSLLTGGKSLQGNTGTVFNVPVTVTQNISGNLVTSAINTVINPADGIAGNAQTITLLNNGSTGATITGINISATNPIVTSAPSSGTNCVGLASLAANASCSFKVNVSAAQTQSGQAPVTITYSNGASSGNTNGSLSFNIVYISATPSPALTMGSGQGSLTNVLVNSTQYYYLTVKNTGSVTLNNIAFNLSPSTPAGMSISSANSNCATNGTQSLGPNDACTLAIQYSPTATATASTVTVTETSNYTDNGTTQSYASASASIAYSAINTPAFLYISPNYVSYAIRADGVDTATQGFTVYNSGSVTATSVVVTPPVFTGFSSSNTCGATIASLGSCTVSTTYGPVTAAAGPVGPTTLTGNPLNVAYLPYTGAGTATAFANLVFTASTAALVSIQGITVTGASSGTTWPGPYVFTNTPANQIQFTITYRNTGGAAANNFNVATNSLPVGYIVSGSSTCGFGSTTSTLAATSGTCTLITSAVGGSSVYNPYAISSPLTLNIPGYSYNDTNTGLNTMTAPTFNASTNATVTPTNTLTVTPSNPTTWTGAGNGSGTNSNNFTFTGTASSGALVIYIPTTSLAGGLFTIGGTNRTCTLNTSSPYNCIIPITNTGVIGLGPYNFSFKVLPVGTVPASVTDNTAGAILQGSFTYTN